MTARYASAEWHGDVQSGSGTITVGDGVFEDAYSYASRFAGGEGTNPEQLLAAAHSGCFTSALAAILSAAGHAPECLRTSARVRLDRVEGEPTLARIHLTTVGDVPGIDEDQFQIYAEQARAECPASRALAGIPEIVVNARLGVNAQSRIAPPSRQRRRRRPTSRRVAAHHDLAIVAAMIHRLALELRASAGPPGERTGIAHGPLAARTIDETFCRPE